MKLIPEFHLDHQNLKFEKRKKVISWMANNLENCDQYQLKFISCNDTVVNTVNVTRLHNTATIPSTNLDKRRLVDGDHLFIKIEAVNSESNYVCEEIRPLLLIEENCKALMLMLLRICFHNNYN